MPTASSEAGTGTKLVIVESPHKARTIGGYLGAGYVVESSVGHIRDLPRGDNDMPWVRGGIAVVAFLIIVGAMVVSKKRASQLHEEAPSRTEQAA